TQDKATFTGKYYQMKDAPCDPKPVQRPHPPILIGGMGPKVVLPLVARHADIWNFFAPDDPAEVKAIIASFDALCQKVGRAAAEGWRPLASATSWSRCPRPTTWRCCAPSRRRSCRHCATGRRRGGRPYCAKHARAARASSPRDLPGGSSRRAEVPTSR